MFVRPDLAVAIGRSGAGNKLYLPHRVGIDIDHRHPGVRTDKTILPAIGGHITPATRIRSSLRREAMRFIEMIDEGETVRLTKERMRERLKNEEKDGMKGEEFHDDLIL